MRYTAGMSETRFHLIRHALVEPKARTVFYGAMDVPLCDLALKQDASLFRWLAARLPRPATWVTSNLARTRATAMAVFAAGYPAQPLLTEPDLAEQHLGEWHGIAHDALAGMLRHPAHPFWPHAAEEEPPGGESFATVQARVGAVLDRLAEAHAGEEIVIVAHGGSIRAALAHALGLTGHQALAFSIRNLGVTRLERVAADWRVAAVNEEPWIAPDWE